MLLPAVPDRGYSCMCCHVKSNENMPEICSLGQVPDKAVPVASRIT